MPSLYSCVAIPTLPHVGPVAVHVSPHQAALPVSPTFLFVFFTLSLFCFLLFIHVRLSFWLFSAYLVSPTALLLIPI